MACPRVYRTLLATRLPLAARHHAAAIRPVDALVMAFVDRMLDLQARRSSLLEVEGGRRRPAGRLYRCPRHDRRSSCAATARASNRP